MGKNLVVTGEFMKLCDVSRNTLIHYDNIGLLKPVETNSRGDRFYHPFQSYKIVLIKLLQKSGMSLDNIRTFFFDENDKSKAYASLRSKVSDYDELRKNIVIRYKETLREYRFVKKMKEFLEIVQDVSEIDKPVIKRVSLGGRIAYKEYEKGLDEYSKEYYDEVYDTIRKMGAESYDGGFPIIFQYSKDDFEAGLDKIRLLSSYSMYGKGVPTAKYDGMECIVMRHVGGASSFPYAVNIIKKFLNEHPEYEMLDYVNMITSFTSVCVNGKRFRDRMVLVPLKKRAKKDTFVPYEISDIPVLDQKMEDKKKELLLSSGEFIKLCGLTRNTLNHYEKKGILKPAVVKENGYKQYGITEIFDTLEIKIYKMSGYSIDQIHDFLHEEGRGLDLSLAVKNVEQQIEKMKAELNELAESKRIISHIRESLKLMLVSRKTPQYHHLENAIKYIKSEPISMHDNTSEDYESVVKEAMTKSASVDEYLTMPIGLALSRDKKTMSAINFLKPKADTSNLDISYIKGDVFVSFLVVSKEEFIPQIREVLDEILASGEWKLNGDIVKIFTSVGYEPIHANKMSFLVFFPVVRA